MCIKYPWFEYIFVTHFIFPTICMNQRLIKKKTLSTKYATFSFLIKKWKTHALISKTEWKGRGWVATWTVATWKQLKPKLRIWILHPWLFLRMISFMNAPLVSWTSSDIRIWWVTYCIHLILMTGYVQLTRGAIIMKSYLKNAHFSDNCILFLISFPRRNLRDCFWCEFQFCLR